MHVPFLDLQAQYQSIKPEIYAAVSKVLESQKFMLGEEVEKLEKNVSDYVGAKFGCGVSSGTDALLIALMNEGIGPGDEVITTPLTFFATAGSIARTGATPVFADIDPETFNLDPDQVEEKITHKTRAIIVVHLFGQMADMEAFERIAKKHHLVLIEDAAQAIGSEDHGKRAGSTGDYGCFSFHPSKTLGAAGDAGMVVTSDPERDANLRILRNHGAQPKYYHALVGGNFRLDAIQAAILNVKFTYLDQWIEDRSKCANRYEKMFKEEGPIGQEVVVSSTKTERHTFNNYVIRTQERDKLRSYLKELEVETQVYYPLALHLQKCFHHLGYSFGDFPISEQASHEVIALPIYPELTENQQEFVVECITKFIKISLIKQQGLAKPITV
ncbi:DegT/DnrJ/EryC1/StrS family aminotransferase [Patescibacteria group bacterium]|nr:DegT/DnrJ/EryC1/StrS family aminotransferase [Patescibacteria group bacterium]MBU2259541.1 DegT/DnrJ/EryC1/StrS family aminotransferase [Patescibacteria group bacterium]